MRIRTDDGVELAVEEAGAGPALLLVHGFGGAKEDFADHVEALAGRARVVTFDHRGHGESDKPDDPGAYSLERMARDTTQVADALGIDTFQLLGHSMGGMIARRVVLAHPGRVGALVLMGTSPGPPPGMDVEIVHLGAAIAVGPDGMETIRQILEEADPLGTPAYQRLLAERRGYREFCEAKWRSLSAVMWATMAVDIVEQPDELPRMHAVACPTLVIVGEQDETFLEPSNALASTIAGARLVVIPEAGHSPQMESPHAWRSALEGFLHA
jgi:3-oxoadipate enol-lactonase